MEEIHGQENQADIAPPQPHGAGFIAAYNNFQDQMGGDCHIRMFS